MSCNLRPIRVWALIHSCYASVVLSLSQSCFARLLHLQHGELAFAGGPRQPAAIQAQHRQQVRSRVTGTV
eukprot:1097702-Pleurochrysis_carterae.AAC.8